MGRVHADGRPMNLVGANQENWREDSWGTYRAEEPLLNGLVDEVVVGMVWSQEKPVRPFGGTV